MLIGRSRFVLFCCFSLVHLSFHDKMIDFVGKSGIILTVLIQIIINEVFSKIESILEYFNRLNCCHCVFFFVNQILYYMESTSGVDFWGTTQISERFAKLHSYSFFCYFVFTFASYVHESQYLELIFRLQKANQHKTEFLCKTSHELRSIIIT